MGLKTRWNSSRTTVGAKDNNGVTPSSFPLGLKTTIGFSRTIVKVETQRKAISPMPQSLAQILVHLVFSTKNREPRLTDAIRDELHAYIGGIVERHDGTLLKTGSVADHIHLLLAHPRTCAPSDLVQDIKTGSSKWLKNKAADSADFYWQSGYGIF